MALYIGVDGGGTKTEVSLFNSQTELSLSLGGNASRTSSVGWDESRELVRALIDEGLHQCGATPQDVKGISLCLSGIDLPEQSIRMARQLKTYFQNSAIEVVNDSLAILTAGMGGHSGIVLIAGTGSICMGEGTNGRIVRAGGYGSFIGDEGSAYEIGRQGLIAAIQSAEERGPFTTLWHLAEEQYAVTSPNQIIERIYSTEYPLAAVANFAPIVLEAREEDTVAREIIEGATRSQLALIESVYKRLCGQVETKVVLSGGLFTNSDVLVNELQQCSAGKFQLRVFRDRPSSGAVLRAIRFAEQREQGTHPGIQEMDADPVWGTW